MARPHIPDLDSIRALPNPEIKFYAIIGAVISLGAGLELAYFDVFAQATRLDQKMAASVFYKVLNTGTRRDMAHSAMRLALQGRPELAEWCALYERIVSVTGASGERNLLGHSVVIKEVIHSLVGGGFGGGLGGGYSRGPYSRVPYSGGALGRVILEEPRFRVSQDEIQIMAGTKKPREADFDLLFNSCNEVLGVLNDLEEFLGRI